jgi:OOP family OmpA-OmpF porin
MHHQPRRCSRPRSRAVLPALGALCCLLASLLIAGRLQAQSVRLDRFRAVERADDGFGVRRLGEIGHLRIGIFGTGDFARDPLIVGFDSPSGNSSLRSVVERMTMGKADLTLSLWDRLVLLGGIDGSLGMQGTKPPPFGDVRPADGSGLGDASLGARLRFVGSSKSVFSLGMQGVLILPLPGEDRAYRGEDGVAGRAELIADVRAPYFHGALNAGALLRPAVQIGSASLGNDALLALALGLPLHPSFEILFELLSSLGFQDFGAPSTTHIEWLGGVKANLDTVYLGAAAGTGLSNALGTPEFRVVWQLGMLSLGRRPAPPPAASAAPQPEAEPDADGDGIPDRRDDCTIQPEDIDGFRDGDGCPDPDNDGDGVPDDRDPCMDEPEDVDGFEDESGCPDPDNDQDGVLDAADACPLEPGVPEERGCKARAQLSATGEIAIDSQIQFESGKDVILGESHDLLDAIRKILDRHPEIALLRIEGHTDSRGNDRKNLRLSQARARAVALWLVQRGIVGSRVMAYGCGEKHPLSDNSSELGRRMNRRVAFQVVEPVPRDPQLAQPPPGCQPASLGGVVRMR